MLTKKDMRNLVKMSCLGAGLGFALVLVFALAMV